MQDNGRDLHLLRYMDGVVYAKGHRRMRFTWPPNDPSSTIRMNDPTVPLGKTMTLDWQALGEKLRSGLASFVQRSAHAKQVCRSRGALLLQGVWPAIFRRWLASGLVLDRFGENWPHACTVVASNVFLRWHWRAPWAVRS
jgi:hypothetical protein